MLSQSSGLVIEHGIHSSAPSTAVTSGLIGQYALTDASGTTMPDISGSANNGTWHIAPTLSGGGVLFNQTNYGSFPVAVSNNWVTVQVFGKFDPTPGANGLAIMGSDAAGTTNVNMTLAFDNASRYLGMRTLANGAWQGTAYGSPQRMDLLTYMLDATQDKWFVGTTQLFAGDVTRDPQFGAFGGLSFRGGNYSIGQRNALATLFKGTMYYCMVYNRQLTAAEVAQNYRFMRSTIQGRGVTILSNHSGDVDNKLVVVGDSLSDNVLNQGGVSPWTQSLGALNYTYTLVDLAVGGTTCYLWDGFGTSVDDQYSPTSAHNTCVVWLGTNDWAIKPAITAATVEATLNDLCSKRRSAGYKVVVATMISRNGGETFKNAYNTLIRANWTNYADALCDLAANANIGADGAWSNATYFQGDGIHLTATGQSVVAGLMTTAINTF